MGGGGNSAPQDMAEITNQRREWNTAETLAVSTHWREPTSVDAQSSARDVTQTKAVDISEMVVGR